MDNVGQIPPDDVPPTSLAALIELDEVIPQRVWREEELGAILAHELATPAWLEIGPLRLSGVSPTSLGGGGIRLATLGELLHHPEVPLELLVRLKEFAKQQRHDPGSHLPEPVAAALYALAVAAAILRHGQRITRLPVDSVLNHLKWAVGRPWVDAPARQLLQAAITASASGPGT
jgi:hypothetical protein